MKRIAIIGSPGAGKSTFAQQLGDILKIKVIHLDRKFWRPGWKEKPRENRVAIQQHLVQRDQWIIEGTYLSSSDSRLNAADTIIFLDIPRLVCLWRVIRRRVGYKRQPRPDLPEGCPERLSFFYILKVLVFPHRGRKLLLDKIKYIYADGVKDVKQTKTILTFQSSKEVTRFLLEQKQKQHTTEKKHPAKEGFVGARKILVLAEQ